jgi:hypothetical protein
MVVMVGMGCFVSCLGVNPNDYRKAGRPGETAFNEPARGDVCVCFPMFTFRFHVQLAAKQH